MNIRRRWSLLLAFHYRCCRRRYYSGMVIGIADLACLIGVAAGLPCFYYRTNKHKTTPSLSDETSLHLAKRFVGCHSL
jgi:hypothetical protein